MVQRVTARDWQCDVGFEIQSWGQGRVSSGWQIWFTLPDRSSVPNRARSRLQSVNTYKCRSTVLTHRLPDMVKLNLEGKKFLFVNEETFWGRNQTEVFIWKLSEWRYCRKNAASRTRVSHNVHVDFIYFFFHESNFLRRYWAAEQEII